MGDDPYAGVTAPHHVVGVRVDVDVVVQLTQGDLRVFLGLFSGSVYFLVNLNVHFLQTHKNRQEQCILYKINTEYVVFNFLQI